MGAIAWFAIAPRVRLLVFGDFIVTGSDTIIIGLGNPILSDDAIGWRVVERLHDMLQDDPAHPLSSVEIRQACIGGLSLAEMLVDHRRAIIVDAIMTEGGTPGTVFQLTLSDLPGTLNSSSAHDTNLITALQALRRFGADVPENDAIDFVAIEAQDVLTFSECCTPAVGASIPAAAEVVVRLLVSGI
jgi:hydrogenase maturation protease